MSKYIMTLNDLYSHIGALCEYRQAFPDIFNPGEYLTVEERASKFDRDTAAQWLLDVTFQGYLGVYFWGDDPKAYFYFERPVVYKKGIRLADHGDSHIIDTDEALRAVRLRVMGSS